MNKNLFSTFKESVFDTYAKDSGKLLVHTGALGWLFSSLAQVTIVASDQNISKKDKKFLVPQEICDGVTNVFLYYTVSKLVKDSGDWCINKGYLITDDVENVLRALKPQINTCRSALKGIAESLESSPDASVRKLTKKPVELLFKKIDLVDSYKNMTPIQQAEIKKLIETAEKNLGNFKNGVGTVTAIAASILASNILTPFARNKMASLYQQKFIMKEDAAKKPDAVPQKSAKPMTTPPLPKTFQTFNVSGNMRI